MTPTTPATAHASRQAEGTPESPASGNVPETPATPETPYSRNAPAVPTLTNAPTVVNAPKTRESRKPDARAARDHEAPEGRRTDSRVARTDSRVATRWIAAAAASFVAAALLLPFVGPAPIDLDRLWIREEPEWSIFLQLRVTRTLLGLFGGAALGFAGVLFQAMLRDALATPYTLGVSSGASLGAVAAIAMGWHSVVGVPGVWAGALIGATLVLLLVVSAASRDRQMSTFGLLLAGVATNSVCSAVILLVHSLSGVSQSFAISRWLIGSIDAIDYPALTMFIAGVTALSLVVMTQARRWNLISVGESWASTRGVDVPRLMRTGYLSGSLLAAGTVALTGPIGFVGLVVPHLVRTRVSADHRVLLPCAFFFGGLLLASCDALSRVLLAPAEIPAGAMTAFIGGPYLVWLVRRRL
jgi:iron complex transport system permease protein